MTNTQDKDSLQQLVYGISHDMGASLRAVIRFSELLQTQLADRLTEREAYWLELVNQGGNKAQEMVDALLVYSRLVTQAEPPCEFSINELGERILEERLFKQQLSPDRLTLTADLGQSLVFGVRSHWERVFASIIDNALLFHPKDEEHHRLVNVQFEITDATARLTVEDNGIGMSVEHMKNASRPFMRGVSDNEYPGLGMGLSYCDRIAQLNQGRLLIEPSPLGGIRAVYEQRLTASE